MQENTKMVAAVALALLVGGVIGYLVCCGGKDHHAAENSNGNVLHHASDGQMHNTEVSGNLEHTESMMDANLMYATGDEFDKAFLESMIVHHDGAVVMANIALTQGNRQEIKDLAEKIINAQLPEIEEMNVWLDMWYGSTENENLMHGHMDADHDAMPHAH